MPVYDYVCGECGNREERLVISTEKDDSYNCSCGGVQTRVPSGFSIGKPGYQMKAVTGDGAHVKGHFGKEAKRDKSGRRKG